MADFTKLNGYNVKDAGAGRSLDVSGSDLSLKDSNGNTLSTVQIPGGGGGVNKYSDLTDVNLTDPVNPDQVAFYNGSGVDTWSQFFIEPKHIIELDVLRVLDRNGSTLMADVVNGTTSFSAAASTEYKIIFGQRVVGVENTNHCKAVAKYRTTGFDTTTGTGGHIQLLPYTNDVTSVYGIAANKYVKTKQVYEVPNLPLMCKYYSLLPSNLTTTKMPIFTYTILGSDLQSIYTNINNQISSIASLTVNVQPILENGEVRIWCELNVKFGSSAITVANLDTMHLVIPILGYDYTNGLVNFRPQLEALRDVNTGVITINATNLTKDIATYMSVS